MAARYKDQQARTIWIQRTFKADLGCKYNNTCTMQPKETVDVGLFLYEWSCCLSAKYQRDQLYRFAKFDDCSRQWKDLKNALRAKVSRDETYARTIMQDTHYHHRTTESPTVGVIWELKSKPGWSYES